MQTDTPARRTFTVVLYGTITRDIRRMECDAVDEDEVREICAKEMRTYRIHSIAVQETGGGDDLHSDDPSPQNAKGEANAD